MKELVLPHRRIEDNEATTRPVNPPCLRMMWIARLHNASKPGLPPAAPWRHPGYKSICKQHLRKWTALACMSMSKVYSFLTMYNAHAPRARPRRRKSKIKAAPGQRAPPRTRCNARARRAAAAAICRSRRLVAKAVLKAQRRKERRPEAPHDIGFAPGRCQLTLQVPELLEFRSRGVWLDAGCPEKRRTSNMRRRERSRGGRQKTIDCILAKALHRTLEACRHRLEFGILRPGFARMRPAIGRFLAKFGRFWATLVECGPDLA